MKIKKSFTHKASFLCFCSFSAAFRFILFLFISIYNRRIASGMIKYF